MDVLSNHQRKLKVKSSDNPKILATLGRRHRLQKQSTQNTKKMRRWTKKKEAQMNTGGREGKAVPIPYYKPTAFLIYNVVKSWTFLSVTVERKHLREREKIRCNRRNGYFVMASTESLLHNIHILSNLSLQSLLLSNDLY